MKLGRFPWLPKNKVRNELLLLACLLGLGEVGMCVSSLLLSPFLCVTHRDRRVNFRLWTLCLLFPFTQFCAEPNLGKQLRCHHMFIYVWMSMPHLSCLHVEPCMLEFYKSRTKRWVGGLIAHFLPCCFHFDASTWFLAASWPQWIRHTPDFWNKIQIIAILKISVFLLRVCDCRCICLVDFVTLHG